MSSFPNPALFFQARFIGGHMFFARRRQPKRPSFYPKIGVVGLEIIPVNCRGEADAMCYLR